MSENFSFNYLCRQIAGCYNNIPIEIIKDSNQPPTRVGESYYWTTPSGKTRVGSPRAYGWRTKYNCSTLRVEVGEHWKPKIPKGMELRTKGGTHLVRLSDGMDFHFVVFELIARKNFCTWVRKMMAINYKNRLKTKKLQNNLNKYIKEKNSFVCFLDSRRAGNCTEGTLNYAKKKFNLSKEDVLGLPYLPLINAKLLAKDMTNDRVKGALQRAFERETMVCI